jgi:hypothetical protein
MKFVEFLEFIGRLANFKFKGLPEPLETKIENLLEIIFPVF